MQKIPTIFLRDPSNLKLVSREPDPDCAWVFAGQGVATEKWDGSACLILNGILYRRHRVKPGKPKPPGWIHWNREEPADSGHGWALVGEGTADQHHREAFSESGKYHREVFGGKGLVNGTYELVGPSVQGNPYHLKRHELWKHGNETYMDVPRDFDGLRDWLEEKEPMEGLVFHHLDGRMAKIKRRDFGLRWPVK